MLKKVIVGAALMMLCSCNERPWLEMVQGTLGKGETIVKAATLDADGNLVVVGSTLSRNLATAGTFQQQFQSRANLQYFDPEMNILSEIATSPKYLYSLVTPAGNRSDIYANNTTNVYRLQAGDWIDVTPRTDLLEGLIIGSVAVAQTATYFRGQNQIAPNLPSLTFLSRDSGASWRLLPLPPDMIGLPVHPDTHNPCRILDGFLQSNDCGFNWKPMADTSASVARFDPRGNGRWLGFKRNDVTRQRLNLVETTDPAIAWRLISTSVPPRLCTDQSLNP